MGYCIKAVGIKPTEEKVRDIKFKPYSKNKIEMFLSLFNFYHSFLQDKSYSLGTSS